MKYVPEEWACVIFSIYTGVSVIFIDLHAQVVVISYNNRS
jgi:hypothetical protein